MKPLVVPDDAERLTIDYLESVLEDNGEDVTVGIAIPETWTPGTKEHVQVGLDGTTDVIYAVRERASVRVTCWSSSATTAKRLALLCQALLLSHPGGRGIRSVRPGTGLLPTKDPATGAQLGSISVGMNLSYAPLN